MSPPMDQHPLLRALGRVDEALDDLAPLDPTYLPMGDKANALRAVSRELARLEGLRLELLAASDDVAQVDGARSAGAWLAQETRAGAPSGVRDQRLADGLGRWGEVRRALRDGLVNAAQAGVVVAALDDLPDGLDAQLTVKACAQLLADAGHFRPRELRILGRRVLEVVAPEVAEGHEERLLRAEDRRARRETRLTFRPRGDGMTEVFARLPDHVADRLRAYLDSFTAPRRRHLEPTPLGDVDLLPLPRRRGEAFCTLLKQMPTDRLPTHGGTATSVVAMIDYDALCRGVGSAELSTGGKLSVAEVRRLACGAGILPAVLGGAGEILDLGRSRRLFSPAQRKALAIRDRHCRAEDCQIPAAWCEAHHARDPWHKGGSTDLSDGLLLCSFHHHRAHDEQWATSRMPNGDLRYARRT